MTSTVYARMARSAVSKLFSELIIQKKAHV